MEKSIFFNSPKGISLDSLGKIYVADTGNNRIQKFTSDGSFIKEWGGRGTSPGEFSNPSGIAVDVNKGLVYVADTGNNRIQKIEDSTIKNWIPLDKSNQGYFDFPTSITI